MRWLQIVSQNFNVLKKIDLLEAGADMRTSSHRAKVPHIHSTDKQMHSSRSSLHFYNVPPGAIPLYCAEKEKQDCLMKYEKQQNIVAIQTGGEGMQLNLQRRMERCMVNK
jgi:hypothetical protein